MTEWLKSLEIGILNTTKICYFSRDAMYPKRSSTDTF